MKIRSIKFILPVMMLFILVSCNSQKDTSLTEDGAISPANPENTLAGNEKASKFSEWFQIPLTDVQTGETFTISEYSGSVVLVETMAMWCPNCIVQAHEVRELHKLLENPDDLVSVSLDVDVNEDAATLKDYSEKYGFEWHFAIAPLEVARALGNLYSAQYLNPPLSPMLLIDRRGEVHELPYGQKKAEDLYQMVQPYLSEQ